MSEELRAIMAETLDRVGETSRDAGFFEAVVAAGKLAMEAHEFDLASLIFALKPKSHIEITGDVTAYVPSPIPVPVTDISDGWTKWDGKTIPKLYSPPSWIKLRRTDGAEHQMPVDFDWLTDGLGDNPVVAWFDEIPF